MNAKVKLKELNIAYLYQGSSAENGIKRAVNAKMQAVYWHKQRMKDHKNPCVGRWKR